MFISIQFTISIIRRITIPLQRIVTKLDVTVSYAGNFFLYHYIGISITLQLHSFALNCINIKWDVTVWYAGPTTRKCLRPKNCTKSAFLQINIINIISNMNDCHIIIVIIWDSQTRMRNFSFEEHSFHEKCSWFWILELCELLPESRPGIHASKPSRQINFQAAE